MVYSLLVKTFLCSVHPFRRLEKDTRLSGQKERHLPQSVVLGCLRLVEGRSLSFAWCLPPFNTGFGGLQPIGRLFLQDSRIIQPGHLRTLVSHLIQPLTVFLTMELIAFIVLMALMRPLARLVRIRSQLRQEHGHLLGSTHQEQDQSLSVERCIPTQAEKEQQR